MSYSRSYNKRISVPYSGTVSYRYPASEKGGTANVHYSGTTQEDIEVYIDVDTNPFDNSVEHCNTNVNLLTGAVVATEAAQIASINKNSKKVASTIVNGFFGYIRSEISQQISELTQNIDAQLIHLKELSDSCVAKKKQMEGDFNRISGRYMKIFDDLNKELSNRIMELDKPTFVFKKELDNQNIRSVKNDMVNIVLVFGKEGGMLASKLGVTLAKKRALDTLNQAKIFLLQQKYLNYTVQRSMINENITCKQYSPVCFIESNSERNQISKQVYSSSYISSLNDNTKVNEIIEDFSDSSKSWTTISVENNETIRKYFNSEINNAYEGADPHTERVKAMINKIANIGTIQTINN
jgi:hypothetical protein